MSFISYKSVLLGNDESTSDMPTWASTMESSQPSSVLDDDIWNGIELKSDEPIVTKQIDPNIAEQIYLYQCFGLPHSFTNVSFTGKDVLYRFQFNMIDQKDCYSRESCFTEFFLSAKCLNHAKNKMIHMIRKGYMSDFHKSTEMLYFDCPHANEFKKRLIDMITNDAPRDPMQFYGPLTVVITTISDGTVIKKG